MVSQQGLDEDNAPEDGKITIQDGTKKIMKKKKDNYS